MNNQVYYFSLKWYFKNFNSIISYLNLMKPMYMSDLSSLINRFSNLITSKLHNNIYKKSNDLWIILNTCNYIIIFIFWDIKRKIIERNEDNHFKNIL